MLYPSYTATIAPLPAPAISTSDTILSTPVQPIANVLHQVADESVAILPLHAGMNATVGFMGILNHFVL